MIGVLIRENRDTERCMHYEDTEIQKEDSYMKMEAEIEVILPQTKECLGAPEIGRDKEGSSPRTFIRSTVQPVP